MAKKEGMLIYKTVGDYIANQPEHAQHILIELRAIIHEAVPDVEEVSNIKAPNFKLVENAKNNQQLMMASYAKFVSFYPFPSTLEHFKDELEDFTLGKGAIQFPFDTKLRKDLLIEIIKFRRDEILKTL